MRKKSTLPEYISFRADTLLNMTYGRLPRLLFSENGKIIYSTNYNTFNEKDVCNFLLSSEY